MTRTTSDHRLPRLFSWLLMVLTLSSVAGVGWLLVNGCEFANGDLVSIMLSGIAFAVLGLLTTITQPTNRIGRLCSVIGLLFVLMLFLQEYAVCGLSGILSLPFLPLMSWVGYVSPFVFALCLFVLLPFWFPDGKYPSPHWRLVGRLSIAAVLVVVALVVFLPGPMRNSGMDVQLPLDNPFGLIFLPEVWGSSLYYASKIVLLVPILLAILSLFQRWRHSRGDTRQQLKWFTWFLTTVVSIQMVFEFVGGLFYPAIFESIFYKLVTTAVILGFPTVIGVAIFKYRLYEIDVIIRRTLVYSIITALLALIYFGSIVLIQPILTAVSGQQSPISIVISTLLIAALFTPIRSRVQSFVDRRFYRRKYDAARVLDSFSKTARDEVDINRLANEMVHVVQETIQPEIVLLWMRENVKREA